MSLRNLVDGECGGVNPIVGVSRHFTHDKSYQNRNFLPETASISGVETDTQQLVNEFIAEQSRHVRGHASGQRFRMESLICEIEQIQSPAQTDAVSYPDAGSGQWTEEYLTHKDGGGVSDTRDTRDMLEWAHARWADEYLAESEKQMAFDSTQITSKWTREFEDNQNDADTDLALEARKLVQSIDDPVLDETDFIKFVKKIGNSETTITSDGKVLENPAKPDADVWSKEFDGSNLTIDDSKRWAHEMVAEKDEHEKDDTEFWAKLAQEWKDMGLIEETGESEHPWINEFDSFVESYKDYKFNEENPLRDHPDPFQEGLKKLKDGDIPSAVLLFEASCQQQPDSVLSWQYLGTSQAENEHDSAAIAALKKCLDLDPDNLIAVMALAVSYTNESMQHQACAMLKEWIRRNPKYQNIIDQSPSVASNPPFQDGATFGRTYSVDSIITSGQHQEVKDLFIAAARQSPNDPDPDVQCGLGVLFNLSGEYDKAADCFRAALHVRPNDSCLWNRLGATLANGSKSEEAINAYREAISLSPGFVRSRFNLGISCINLGAYREAAEHFLTVLNIQAAGRGPNGNKPLMSGNVWSTLRMVMTFMGRSDLYTAVDNKDLKLLNREFSMDLSS